MTRPRLEVAEVIRSCRDAFLEQYGAALTPEQHRASKLAFGDRIAAAKRAHGDIAWADRHEAVKKALADEGC